jgi:hypothetical protein
MKKTESDNARWLRRIVRPPVNDSKCINGDCHHYAAGANGYISHCYVCGKSVGTIRKMQGDYVRRKTEARKQLKQQLTPHQLLNRGGGAVPGCGRR